MSIPHKFTEQDILFVLLLCSNYIVDLHMLVENNNDDVIY